MHSHHACMRAVIDDVLGASTVSTSDPSLSLDALQAQLSAMLDAPSSAFPSLSEATRRVRILETTLETVPVGVVVAEVPSGQILFANRHVQKLAGHADIYSANIGEYERWVGYHANGQRVRTREWPLARVIAEGLPSAELDFQHERTDGSRLWLRAIARPIRSGDGAMIGAAVALIDIDQEHRQNDVQRLVIGELNHRAKNMMAVIKSIVGQTLRREQVSADIVEKVSDRLDAYARGHAQLNAQPDRSAALGDIAAETLRGAIEDGRIELSGPVVAMPERTGLALAMAFHELATNAVKYGALSTPDGRVSLDWSLSGKGDGRMVTMRWIERGGPPPVAPAAEADKGFGHMVIDRALTMQTRGTVTVAYPPEGFCWTFTAPAPDVV
jgi:PAS domain S-box-containing protein